MEFRDCAGLAAWVALVAALGCSPSEEGGPSPAAGSAAPVARAVRETPTPPSEPAAPSREELIARGRSVYVGNCSACHNMDPSLPGSLGPEVTGASRELLVARVLHKSYPEGYTPKRETGLMVALPHLKDEIDALFAYLNQ